MEEYLSFKNQILNMSGRNQREPYFPRDAQPLRPRPADYAHNMNRINPQTSMNANRSKTAERIRRNNNFIDPSNQYRSNPRTPSNTYYAIENRLNTSVEYRSHGGRKSSETNANQQKAKFLFFALQKCMRKVVWKIFVKKLEQRKTANSMSYYVPQSLSKTLPLDEIPGINDSRSINYSEIRNPNASYIDHYTPYTDAQKNLVVNTRNSFRPIHPQNHQHSNQKAKNASFSAILPELQNEWSPDTNSEIFFPRSNGTNQQRQFVDPNQLNIQGYASNSSWGHTKYLDAYASQSTNKIPLAKNTNQRSSFYNPRDYQSNPITAGNYTLSTSSKDKNYGLFCLLLKKTLTGFQKKAQANSFAELKKFYKRAVEYEKETKGNITREDASIGPIATIEESNLLEYSNRTLLSPSNAVFPVYPSARQQKLNEIVNREKKLKLQFLVLTLQKTFSLRLKESFTRIVVSDEQAKLHANNIEGALLLTLLLQKKIGQQMHSSFDNIKKHSQEEEKAVDYRFQQVHKGLILQLLLRKSIDRRKRQALSKWREFASRARLTAYEKKDVLLSQNLNSMVTKYKDITNSCEKINKRYSEFCQRQKKSTVGNEDSFNMSFTHDPLDKENLNKGQSMKTPSKTGSIKRISSMSRAKQKSIEDLGEIISRKLLKDAFSQIKRRQFFINIQGLTQIEKSNKVQPKSTQGNMSLDLKISNSLLETFQQSAKKQAPKTNETNSSQNLNPDLLSAINFLKGL